MKKYLFIIIIFLLLLVLFSKQSNDTRNKKNIKEERKAIFFSYIELKEYIKGKSIKESKQNIDKIIDNLSDFNFNMLILQVRSFSDAIYESKIYPWSNVVSSFEGENPGFDILEYFIKQTKEKNIEVHAWINPYRIRNTSDTSTISKKNKAYTWLNTSNVMISDKGIFYNPASNEVQKLIIDGVEELINNYDIKGIHFDDYFYTIPDIDLENYNEYLRQNEHISLQNYRLLVVNKLVEEVHKITKKNNILFGISPEGNISNNYSSNYADVYEWGKSDKYVDYLMPQVYYGFYNEAQPFHEVLNNWSDIVKEGNVKIIPALAFYKTGQVDYYAKNGSNEWVENSNIIMRQVLISRNIKNYEGFAIFRYDSIFNNSNQTENTIIEIENLKKVMKT